MSRGLKHLNALRALEASARLGSFTRAAAELDVTPAAVGQQVRILEDYLGQKIFYRTPQGLRVTAASASAVFELGAGFDRLEAGFRRLASGASGKQLAVSVAPALAARWLAPRLQGLYDRCPQIDLRLDTSLSLVDMASGEFDLALRYSNKPANDLDSALLFDEYQIPVCAPAIAPNVHSPIEAEQILYMPLLHIEFESDDSDILSWEQWGAQQGLASDRLQSGARYPDSTMALQAALNGQGVAFCGLSLVIDDLTAGRLIAPLGPRSAKKASYAYQMMSSPLERKSSTRETFIRWINQEAGLSRKSMEQFLQHAE